ncbi:hypothetical protein HSE3_gp061 [Klebsiella phage vB_KleS-HSE3]|nr:hypothetical protein HSE3_gp061 [Klebsiella phage vB_KleS-HSE3]
MQDHDIRHPFAQPLRLLAQKILLPSLAAVLVRHMEPVDVWIPVIEPGFKVNQVVILKRAYRIGWREQVFFDHRSSPPSKILRAITSRDLFPPMRRCVTRFGAAIRCADGRIFVFTPRLIFPLVLGDATCLSSAAFHWCFAGILSLSGQNIS